TVPRHNIPDGWPVQITCVKSPAQLNSDPQGESPYYFVKVVDADTLELNEVNAHCWKAFSGSGLVVFNKPLDLTGWQCRAQVRTRIGGDVLLSWVSDQPGEGSEALVDVAASAFVLRIDPATTEAIAWRSGVYDLEAVSPDGNVHAVVGVSRVFVSDEVTA